MRLRIASQVVEHVAEVEVRVEDVGIQPNRTFVQRLRLGNLVTCVVNVGEVDERRHHIRGQVERN